MKSHIRTRGIPFTALTTSTEPSIANLYWPIRNLVSEDFLARHVKSAHSKKWEGLMFLSTKHKVVAVRRDAPYKDELFKNCFNNGEATTDLLISDEDAAEIETLFKNTLAFEFKKFSSYVEVTVTAENWTISVAVGLSKIVRAAPSLKRPRKLVVARKAKQTTLEFLQLHQKHYSTLVWGVVNHEFDEDIAGITLPGWVKDLMASKNTPHTDWAKDAIAMNAFTTSVMKILRKHIWVKAMGFQEEDFCNIVSVSNLDGQYCNGGTMQNFMFSCSLMRISPHIPIQIASSLYTDLLSQAACKS